jgi:hypothetical protein
LVDEQRRLFSHLVPFLVNIGLVRSLHIFAINMLIAVVSQLPPVDSHSSSLPPG